MFMQRFRNLGLIEMSTEHFLIIKENKLTAYLVRLLRAAQLLKPRRPAQWLGTSRCAADCLGAQRRDVSGYLLAATQLM
jgi:hypothetical protein